MREPSSGGETEPTPRVLTAVLLFWVGYVALTLTLGFATSITIPSEVWQLTAWGFLSSAGLLVLPRLLERFDGRPASLDQAVRPSSLGRFAFGVLLGAASFGVHLAVVHTFAGPIRLEVNSEVGVVVAVIFFLRFLATSCMEEIGFRGYTLRRLENRIGVWPAVLLTAVPFGLSHLLYGWSLETIALGVVPGGLLWGMSAVATRGLAVPIGLHAAWNFTNWSVGGRKETGLLRMALEEDASTGVVGTVSYLAIFAILTLAFWLLHRRNTRASRA